MSEFYGRLHYDPELDEAGRHPVPNEPPPLEDSRDGRDRRPSLADRLRATLLDTAAVRALPAPEPLVANYLARDSLAVLYGPSGGGKTFLSLDWTLHVATGSWWNGHEVHAGPVVYVIAEGASGIGARIDAWTAHHRIYQLEQHQPVWWLPQAINLTDLGDVYAFLEVVAPLEPALIVFDTLARCLIGAEENSARDIGLVVDRLDRIRRTTGACVLADHHTGKDGAAGPRGSSALRAAVDTELELSATDERITLKVTKQKDGPESSPLSLARIPAGGSCVVVPVARLHPSDELAAGDLETLEVLRGVQVPGGIATSVWLKSHDKIAESTFYDRRARLVARGRVVNVGAEKQPRYRVAEDEE